MKVLVVKTSSMGDVIHTLPALTDAAQALPGIRFDWAVEEGFAEIPAWHPAVDRVIPVAIRRWRKTPWRTWRSGEWGAYKRTLRTETYEAVIDAQGLLKSAALVTRYARGPKIGLDKASAREPIASRFYDRRIAIAKNQHAVERVRRLFAAALNYPLVATRGDAGIAPRFAAAPPARDLVFLHGTTRADKLWPQDHWIELAHLAAADGRTIRILWSNDEERARAERIAAAAANVTVQPRTGLTGIATLLAGAAGIVSVDTGLSHLAAALNRPNVILYGPTDPALVGGYGEYQRSLRAADHPAPLQGAPLLAALTPPIVWAELTALLQTTDHPVS